MPGDLNVADVAVYLQEGGWERTDTWRGAAIWSRAGDEVLVPARDDLGDNAARIRDLLRALAAVESRPVRDVARDIAFPSADAAVYRLFPEEQPPGFTSLPSGLQAVGGLRDMVTAAGRVVLEGPHFQFAGRAPAAIGALLGRVLIGAGDPDDVSYTLLVPFSPSSPDAADRLIGREVMTYLHDATSAVEEAARAADISAFDDTVTAGVSAEFCAALSDLSGPQRREPFEVAFRWSHGRHADLPPRTVAFPAEAGPLMRSVSNRLRKLEASGAAVVVGRVESLHDEAGGADRWRAQVRGELRTDRITGTRRAVWVRLDGQPAYDLAIEAHQAGLPVRAEGVLQSRSGRAELLAENFTVED